MLFVVKTCSALSLLVWSSFKGITYSHYYHYYYYFCYLGSWIATSSKDINIRKAQAWTAINKLSKIWKAPQLCRELKIRVFRATVKAILLYGSQCWTLQLHKNFLLMVPTPGCSAKLLTFRTKTTFQILLYMVLCHRLARHSVPDDYSLQVIVSEE